MPSISPDVLAIERPHANLLKMYAWQSALGLVLFPIVFLPLYFKYQTLRYKFDEEGISASWGVLFKREIYLTYRRIQDIHVTRNVFERWFGIGRLEIQTASGSSSAELVLEGMEHYEAVRDFLYGQMRGSLGPVSSSGDDDVADRDVTSILNQIQAELEGARKALEGNQS